MTIIDLREAQTNLSELVEAIESGAKTEIVISRDGQPLARLVPICHQDASVRIGLMRGMFPDMSLEDFDTDNEAIAREFYDGKIL